MGRSPPEESPGAGDVGTVPTRRARVNGFRGGRLMQPVHTCHAAVRLDPGESRASLRLGIERRWTSDRALAVEVSLHVVEVLGDRARGLGEQLLVDDQVAAED